MLAERTVELTYDLAKEQGLLHLDLYGETLIACFDCQLKHRAKAGHSLLNFLDTHKGHDLYVLHPVALRQQSSLGSLAQSFADNADVKTAWGTSSAVTCSLASKADNTARESTAVDNSTNKYLDALVYLAIALQAGSPANEKAVYVWVYGSEDGTNYTDNATGSDANVTLRSPHNFKLIGVINCPDSGALTYKSHPMSVALAFGGVMPRKWGIVVENQTGVTFNATEGNHTKSYSGVYATVA